MGTADIEAFLNFLVGDRHFRADGQRPGGALTLIEAEALDDVGLNGAQSRRQVVVRGVRLNELVGKDVRVKGTLNPSQSTMFVSDWKVLP